MHKAAGMTGPEHFLAGEHALETAEHAQHVFEAQAHFAAAQTLAFAAMAADVDDDGVANGWAALLGIEGGK